MIDLVLHRYSRHVEFLGADLKEVSQVGAFGSQVLHLACFANRCDDIKALLDAGADKDAVGDLGLRPLHYAVLGGSSEAIHLLLSSGAKPGVENEYGETPAQMAHVLGYAEIEGLLHSIGKQAVYAFDGATTAKERWLEFKSIQQENFWNDD